MTFGSLSFGGFDQRQDNSLVLQTVAAWQGASLLLPSSGQIIERVQADEVIVNNRMLASGYGYIVNFDGSFSDPVSGIRILQGYVPAYPFYDVPDKPFGGTPPALASIAAGTWDAQTAKVFVWGQSMATNDGRGRYAAATPDAWVYYAGSYYPCCDPIVGASGVAGSVWSRFADAAIGRPMNGLLVTKLVLGNCAVGGTSINDWAPGGSLNATLLSRLGDFIATVGMPTHLAYSQGEADRASMSTAAWVSQWNAMMGSVRGIGCTSKVWTSLEAGGNLRSAPLDLSVVNRTPDYYVNIELGKKAIRSAQTSVSTGTNSAQGPDLDALPLEWRLYGDGQHGGELWLTAAGRAWALALFG